MLIQLAEPSVALIVAAETIEATEAVTAKSRRIPFTLSPLDSCRGGRNRGKKIRDDRKSTTYAKSRKASH